MSDDLDDLDAALRRAMATLDGEAPSGYFEALPDRTLARLDDPAIGELADDDAGLQDIRELASETRARLSSRRAAQAARRPADDDAAASSAIWKAVALPEPARLVALSRPDGQDGPDGAAHAGPATATPAAAAAPAGTTPGSTAHGPAVAASAADSLASARSGRPRRRTARVAIAGAGLVAAGAVIYLAIGGGGVRTGAPISAPGATASDGAAGAGAASAPRPRAESPANARTAAGSAVNATPGAGERAAAGVTSAPAASEGAPVRVKTADRVGSGPGPDATSGAAPSAASAAASGAAPEAIGKLAGPVGKRPGKTKVPSKGGGKPLAQEPSGAGGQGAAGADDGARTVGPGSDAPGKRDDRTDGAAQPSLDELIGAPGGAQRKPPRPRFDRTSLSGDDIKRAMTAVAGKAQACFAGTQGLASLRLTVAPSGEVVRVAVTGPFAGTPVGACVDRAVRTATFPPWDGGPQSFNYSYLLSD